MKDRRFWACLALAGLLPILVAAVQQPPGASTAAPAPPARNPSVTLEGREVAVPVTIGPAGPAVGLNAIAGSLGGELTPDPTGESTVLKIGETEVVIGFGSPIITVGDNIVSLSQPVTRGEGGLQVPLDFLRKTYGDLQGYSFDWRPEEARLVIARRAARAVVVLPDVVHLQGMTTVVLQFTEAPNYRILKQEGLIEVQMLDDRLSPPAARQPLQDPLVQDVAISPQAIRIQLVPGAAAESYTLDNPFRLVFDVHQPSTVTIQTPTPGPSRLGTGIRTIVLDPGHGGAESGAVGPSGIQEKELTLLLARELEGRLEGTLGVQVVLTRNEDRTVPHDDRPATANQNKADLFISLHLNSSLGSGAHGAETYFLSQQASDSRAANAAAAENLGSPAGTEAMEGQEAQDLQLILWDLAQSFHLTESQRLAGIIQAELNQTLQLRDRGVKQAPFRVLMGAAMPAVLVELGFISNPDEEKKLQDPAYRADLVAALTRAIGRYKALVEHREPAPGTEGAPEIQGATPSAPPAPAQPQKPAAPPRQNPGPRTP